MTTGSPGVKRTSSGERTSVPALANQIVPASSADKAGFRSFKAGAHHAEEIAAAVQSASHFFICASGLRLFLFDTPEEDRRRHDNSRKARTICRRDKELRGRDIGDKSERLELDIIGCSLSTCRIACL